MKIENLIISPNKKIFDALRMIEENLHKSVIVVDKEKKLLGILSDADIRRALLKGIKLSDQIKKFYNKKIYFVYENKFNLTSVKKKIFDDNLFVVPVINKHRKVTDFVSYKTSALRKQNDKIKVVIMCGGKGERLKPFSDILPKPLIPLNDKTIIEHIIQNFKNNSMNDFIFLTHHKSEIIRSYLKLKNAQLKISYKFIKEHKPLGTCGGLRLLNTTLKKDFFVSNCDTLINSDLRNVYDHHKINLNMITIIVSYKEFQLPYGVFKTKKDGSLKEIIEKPKNNYLVNTGLYVLSPKILKYIKVNKYLDFNDLLKIAKEKKLKIGLFPIEDKHWNDVGQWTEYKQTLKNIYG